MADLNVPEVHFSNFAQLGVLSAIGKERSLSHEQVLQLSYDDAMQTLAYLHNNARYQYEMSQATLPTKN